MYNVLIQKEDVESILNRFGPLCDNDQPLLVKDIDLYRTACVHTSYMEEMDLNISFIPREDWNRLEFIGDKALAYSSAFEMFMRFPQAQEAVLTNLTIGLTRQSRLTDYGTQLNLATYMLLPPSQDTLARHHLSFSRLHASNLEDMVESFIGAIVMDNGGLVEGLKYAHRFIMKLLFTFVDMNELQDCVQDYKGPLINELQVLKVSEHKIVKLHRTGFAISTYGISVPREDLFRLFHDEQNLLQFETRTRRKVSGYDLSDCPATHLILGVGSQTHGLKKADKVQEACKDALNVLKHCC